MANLSARDRLAQRSSSSSAYSSKFSEEPPIPYGLELTGPSSSDSHGPNTVDYVKSSSTAPEDEPKKKRTKDDLPRRKKDAPEDKPPADEPAPVWNKPYKAPEQASHGMDAIRNVVQDGTASLEQSPDEDAIGTEIPQLEPHRSVLSAIMGWDDVPYGKKWNHYIQHGFTGMHGDAFNELMRLAQSEGTGAQPQTTGSAVAYSAELRSRDKRAARILDQWNRSIADWQKGVYAGTDPTATQQFYKTMMDLRAAYKSLGGDLRDLRGPSLNAGGFAQGFQKSLQENRGQLDHLGGLLENIQTRIADNPEWLDSADANTRFDKLSEYVLLMMAQSKGQIADAEKVRAQIENMSVADKAVYEGFMRNFFNANTILQMEALANEGDREAQAFLKNYVKFQQLGETDKTEDVFATVVDGTVELSTPAQSIIDGAMKALNKVWFKMDFNPIDLSTALNSYKTQKDAFLDVIMQQGNTNKEAVWKQAVDLLNNKKSEYNRKLPQLGLYYGWDYQGPTIDENLGTYLKEYQDFKGADPVLASAAISNPHPPTPNEDPAGSRGGAGGLTSTTPPDASRTRWIPKLNKYATLENGRWVIR